MLITIIILVVITVITIAIFASKRPAKSSTNTSSEPSHEQVMSDANRLMLLMEVKRQAEMHDDKATVQAVLNMTYNGPMPVKMSDGSYSSIYSSIFDYNIAGINYRDGIKNYLGEFTGYLNSEPTNEYDHNAIAIYAKDGHHLGYIPADETDAVRGFGLEFPIPVTGKIEEDYDEIESRKFFHGVVFVNAMK